MEEFPKQSYSRERYESLDKKLSTFAASLSDDENVELYQRLIQEANRLRSKYPEPEKYASYHVLIGSTIDDSFMTINQDDFPGEDSVETFIDNLLNQK